MTKDKQSTTPASTTTQEKVTASSVPRKGATKKPAAKKSPAKVTPVSGAGKKTVPVSQKIAREPAADPAPYVIGEDEGKKKKKKSLQIREIAAKIKKTQNDDKIIIPKAPFERALREIAADLDADYRMTAKSVEIARHATEAFMLGATWKVRAYAEHANRNTIQAKDFALWQKVNDEARIPMVECPPEITATGEGADKS